MRKHTDLSLPRIGEEFGGKDHTTVIYSCDKIAQLKETDHSLGQTLRQLGDRIGINNFNWKIQNRLLQPKKLLWAIWLKDNAFLLFEIIL